MKAQPAGATHVPPARGEGGASAAAPRVPLAAWVEAVASAAGGLFSAANVEAMRRATGPIPAAAVSLFGFEVRLDDALAGSDVLLAATAAEGGRALLAGTAPHPPLPARPWDEPGWRSVRRFCALWADPASVLREGADDLWLEFDSADPDAPALPSVFFGPRIAHLGDTVTPAGSTMEVLAAGFGALMEEGWDPEAQARTRSCLRALPAHARVFQAGLMLSRPGSPVRLCVGNLAPGEILAFLAEVAPEGPHASVAAALAAWGPRSARICLCVDVGARVGPRIGLECYPDPPFGPMPADRRPWARFLDALVDAGAALPARRDALLALPHSVDPEEPEAGVDALLGPRYRRTLLVRLHHVKLSLEAGRPLAAKAYVAVRPGWRTR